ncbi:MAG: DoxX family protein [Anaerolineae bacterium]|jgi:hypothetical protein
MNIILWTLQIALAAKFISVTVTHGLRPDDTAMERGLKRFGAATRPLLVLIALGALLGAIGLLLPAAVRAWAWLTPWSAALLALMNLIAVGFHIACREPPKIWVSLVLFALAAFLAYGRWVLVPF